MNVNVLNVNVYKDTTENLIKMWSVKDYNELFKFISGYDDTYLFEVVIDNVEYWILKGLDQNESV